MKINRVAYVTQICNLEEIEPLLEDKTSVAKIKPSKLPKWFKVGATQDPKVQIVYRQKIDGNGYAYLWKLKKHENLWVYSKPKK